MRVRNLLQQPPCVFCRVAAVITRDADNNGASTLNFPGSVCCSKWMPTNSGGTSVCVGGHDGSDCFGTGQAYEGGISSRGSEKGRRCRVSDGGMGLRDEGVGGEATQGLRQALSVLIAKAVVPGPAPTTGNPTPSILFKVKSRHRPLATSSCSTATTATPTAEHHRGATAVCRYPLRDTCAYEEVHSLLLSTLRATTTTTRQCTQGAVGVKSGN